MSCEGLYGRRITTLGRELTNGIRSYWMDRLIIRTTLCWYTHTHGTVSLHRWHSVVTTVTTLGRELTNGVSSYSVDRLIVRTTLCWYTHTRHCVVTQMTQCRHDRLLTSTRNTVECDWRRWHIVHSYYD